MSTEIYLLKGIITGLIGILIFIIGCTWSILNKLDKIKDKLKK